MSAMTTVAQFEISHTRLLDRDGKPVCELPEFVNDTTLLKRLYRHMVLTRIFDSKAVSLQRTGRLGTFASSLGQEAVSVGVATAMREDDVFLPSFREQGGMFVRGVTPKEVFLYWGGDERGSDFVGPREDFAICVPVSSHAPHAVGVGMAFKFRDEDRVAVCIGGDGGTSKGDFYEALNWAGAWKVPVVFVVNNNQWAISVAREAQTAATTLAQKAIACGFEGEQVDGNDVLAVYDSTARALDKARAGGGPHLIEAITYRLSDHTTADDAARYRDDSIVSEHWKEEPVTRVRSFLVGQGVWSRDDEEELIASCAAEVEKSAEDYLATMPQLPETMFDYLYESLPPQIEAQREAVIEQHKASIGSQDA